MTTSLCQESLGNSRPCILWMVVDDLGWSDISHWGHYAEYYTPNIDYLMRTGIELTNYYVHPVCTPTRSAFLTGQYSFSLGLQYLDTMPPGTTEHIPFETPTMMEILGYLGYQNEMIGKWHLGYASQSMTPIGRGFDNHYGYYQDAEDYYTHFVISPKPEHRIPEAHGYDFWDNFTADWSAWGQYSTDLFYDRFEQVINSYVSLSDDDNKPPLFMYMAFQTVHTPIQYPSFNFTNFCQHIINDNRRTYCLKVVYMDYIIGRMIDLYQSLGLWDNTLLILTPDNGGMVDWSNNSDIVEDGVAISYGCNMPYRGGKATLYEGGVKVLGAINGGINIIPEHRRGLSSNVLMHAIDWVPTIIEGLLNWQDHGLNFDGINVWKYLMGEQSTQTINEERVLFLDIEKNGTFAGVRQGNFKYFRGPRSNELICEVEGVCLIYHGYYPCDQTDPYDTTAIDKEFLYDIVNDPYEVLNLAPFLPDKVNEFKQKIDERIQYKYMQEQNATLYLEALPVLHDRTWAPFLF